MAGAFLKSVLDEVVEGFSGQSFKKESVTNALKNRGVKDIELEESGMRQFIETYQGDKIPVDELKVPLAKRTDPLEVKSQGEAFRNVVEMPDGPADIASNIFEITGTKYEGHKHSELAATLQRLKVGSHSTDLRSKLLKQIEKDYPGTQKLVEGFTQPERYEARVLTKKTDKPVSTHFDEPEYYAHTRHTDVGNERIVHEIQSDKHSPGTKAGYGATDDEDIFERTEPIVSAAAERAGLRTISYESPQYEHFANMIEDLVGDTNVYLSGEQGKRKIDSLIKIVNDKGEDTISLTHKEVRDILSDVKDARQPISKIGKPFTDKDKDPKYLQNTLNKTLVDSFNEGQKTVKIRIADDPGLHRSEGVQKWYESSVRNTAKKTAKKIGANYEEKEGYAVIKMPEGGFNLPMYSLGAGVVGASTLIAGSEASAQDFDTEGALAAGWSEEEIQQELNKGKEDESIQESASKQVSEERRQEDFDIQAAQKAGYSEEEIQEFLGSQEPERQDEVSITAGPSVGLTDTTELSQPAEPPEADTRDAEDLLARYENIHSRHATLGKQIKGVWDEEASIEASRDMYDLNQLLIQKMGDEGHEVFLDESSGELMIQTEQGPQELNSGFINAMGAAKFETVGAIGGAIAGAKAGFAAAPPVLPVVGPLAKPIAGAVGLLAGGAVGAFTGSGLDYINNVMETKENLEANVALSKMTDAGMADPVYTIIGGGILKGAFGIGKGTIKLVGQAFNTFKDGNIKGAKEILLRDFDISESQANKLVEEWEKLGVEVPTTTPRFGTGTRELTQEEKVVQAVTETQPGGEAIARVMEDTVGISRNINKRAQDLLATADKMAPGDIGATIKGALQDYTDDVGKYYSETKKLASDVIDKTDYRFDLSKMAIEPVMEKIQSRIADPRKLDIFAGVMNKINGLNQTRTFSDLLDLRQTVNSLSSSVKASDKFSQEGFKKVINTIDREIKRSADQYLTPEQSKAWIRSFRDAKKQYSKMKQMEENVLYKAITKKGVTEDMIIKALDNKIPALDDTFLEVMKKLPPQYRSRAEGAVVKTMIEKFTTGLEGELRATHFPMLAKQLSKVEFKDKASKQMVQTINEMANVFKNDVNLARTAGNIAIPKFQSYLTTDPIIRAKFEIASGVFNYVKSLAPGDQAKRIALVKTAGKLLENPLNVKSTKEFISKFPKDQQVQVKSMVDGLREKWAAAGNKPQEVQKLYKVSKQDKIAVTQGGFGKGYYLTDKVGNPRVTERGFNIIRQDIASTELAGLKEIGEIFGREVTEQEIRKLKSLPMKLKNKGFKGIMINGKAMLFDKPDL